MSLPKGHAPGHVRNAFRAMVEERRPGDPQPSASINGETVTACRLCERVDDRRVVSGRFAVEGRSARV